MTYVVVRSDNAFWYELFNTYPAAQQKADQLNVNAAPYTYSVYELTKAVVTRHRPDFKEEPEVDDGRSPYE